MRIPLPTFWNSKNKQAVPLDEARLRALRLGALAAIVLLAAALRLANLDSLGLANHYYAAAVKSMLQSWHNFFYVAAEPGGSVSVDKPPVGLWIQVLSASIFGVNTIGLLLPQIVAGLFSVVLVYYLVRRSFGTLPGLLAALVLAITPVVVATDRNNTMDSTLIFTLLLTAWAFIKATETARLRYLLLGAVLVGIGFNIKMLEAYLPLPAFVTLYFLGAAEGIWRKLGKLALMGVVLLVISLSWAKAVDLTPTDQRPYVGSSSDNSEISLIVGYNGLNRLLGMFRPSGDGGGLRPGDGQLPQDGGLPPQDGSPQAGLPPRPPPNGPNGGGIPAGPPQGGGFNGTGQAGPLRLFIPPLSKEASWLLPFGLFGLVLLVVVERFAWPVARRHQAAILWGGWLITAGIFFSVAGFFHEYYLSTIAPPLAALVSLGVIEAWCLGRQRPWLAGLLLVMVAALTLALQLMTAQAFVQTISWLPLVVGLFALGIALVLTANMIPHPVRHWLTIAGYASLVAAMLVTPGVWSVLTNLHSSDNQSLPAAYNGSANGPVNSGLIQVNSTLLDYLQTNTQGTYYLMAVPSSMQGADYILATGRPVLYLGGFNGQDNVLTPDSLASLVENGQLRYIYWNASNGGRGGVGQLVGQTAISNWISSQCQVVQGFNTLTRNSGAPDGLNGGAGTNGPFGEEQPVVLYDCAK